MKHRTLRLGMVFTATAALMGFAASSGVSVPKKTLEEAAALRDRALREGRTIEWVRRLTDEVGPRLSGSLGDQKAGPFMKRLLTDLGFTNVRLEPVTVPVWVRGAEEGEITSPVRQRLVLTALGGSVATPGGGLEAEVVEAGSLQALDEMVMRAPNAVRGKIVFFNKLMAKSTPETSGYGESVPVRSQGALRAGKHGASGVLIRSIGTSNNRIPHTGSVQYEEGAARIPAAALSNPDADLLARLLERKEPVRVRFLLTPETKPNAQSQNVIAEIRGRSRPDEFAVLGAHLDSWDLGTGALDDGAGCAIVVEAARLIGLSSRRPLRTIRVVLFANEENGLAGAIAYAREHKDELARHVAALEADSGAGRPTGLVWNAGPAARPLVTEISQLFLPLAASRLREGGGAGPDLSPLVPTDVPLFGLSQDMTHYFDFHHTANDTFDKIDPVALQKSTALAAAWAYVVADLPEPLPRGRIDK